MVEKSGSISGAAKTNSVLRGQASAAQVAKPLRRDLKSKVGKETRQQHEWWVSKVEYRALRFPDHSVWIGSRVSRNSARKPQL